MKIVHTALYTDKFEETIKFYENVFEAENMGFFMTSRKGCWLKIGDTVLEIFESEKLSSEGVFKHIAIECADVDSLFEKSLEYGAEPYVNPKNVTLELKERKNLRIAFIKGINKEQIELCSEQGENQYEKSET